MIRKVKENGKKVVGHIWERRLEYFAILFLVAASVGAYFSFLGGELAKADVTSVSATIAATNYGYRYETNSVSGTFVSLGNPLQDTVVNIFIGEASYIDSMVPDGDLGTATSFCQNIIGAPFSYSDIEPTDAGAVAFTDTNGMDLQSGAWAGLSNGDSTYYKVMAIITTGQACNGQNDFSFGSVAAIVKGTVTANVTSNIVADTTAPTVDHVPAYAASAGWAPVLHALVYDDQTTPTNFNTTSTVDSGAEYLTLYYGTDVSAAETRLDGKWIAPSSNSLFRFMLPTSTAATAGNTFEYYIVANDRSNNKRYVCANPSAASRADCRTSPFVVTAVAGGARTISGQLRDVSNNAFIDTGHVFLGGYATTSIFSGTCVGSCSDTDTYTIKGLPDNNNFEVIGYKSSYCDNRRTVLLGTANVTAQHILLRSGCGEYLTGTAPRAISSFPAEAMNDVPLSSGIWVALDKAITAGTLAVTLRNEANTAVAGTATWCPTTVTAGCSSLPSGTTNAVLFVPSAALAASEAFSLKLTAFDSSTGRPLEGNQPDGSFVLSFTTAGQSFASSAEFSGSFGTTGGAYLPPYVRSVFPSPGATAPPNTDIMVEFNESMSSASISATNIKLFTVAGAAVTLSGIALDNNELRFVAADAGTLSAGDYEIRVYGGAANSSGVTMRPVSGDIAFKSRFTVSGSADATPPSATPYITNNSTGVDVNTTFDFGWNEALKPSTLTSTNIVMRRGNLTVPVSLSYDPTLNIVSVIPRSVLSPNTIYSISFGTGVTDMAGQALASASVFNYTTGSADTTAPSIVQVRCDDYSCQVFFSEQMNHDTVLGPSPTSSVRLAGNFTLTQGGGNLMGGGSVRLNYNEEDASVQIEGLALTVGSNAILTVSSVAADLSGNAITTAGGVNAVTVVVEDSRQTFGDFGDMGMFAPPSTDLTGGGSIGSTSFDASQMGDFGNFTPEQFALGQADMVMPLNTIAGQDANTVHVEFSPGEAVQNGDQFVIVFPKGTTVTRAALAPDSMSRANADMNGDDAGTVGDSAVAIDNTLRQVTITLSVTGSPSAADDYEFDLIGIDNPPLPSTSGGYTATLKLVRSGVVRKNATSMPYFIRAGGGNTLHLRLYAGSSTANPASGATGDVFLMGGGPTGPINRRVTVTDGVTTAVDGANRPNIKLSSLVDGCYFVGTEPTVTLGGTDYFGQMSSEPVCFGGATTSSTLDLLLTPSGGTASVPVTVKIQNSSGSGYSFGAAGADIDVFAGGPGKFVVKTLSGVTTAAANGYTLQLPATDGSWFIGFGPAMPKQSSGGRPAMLNTQPPPPIELIVSGAGTATPSVVVGSSVPAGAAFTDATDTVTFTVAAADKTISGTVTDGSTAIQNIDVFMHKQGFGAPSFDTTDSSGAFSLAVSDYGNYEIGAFKDGIPPFFGTIEVKADGADAGTDADVYYKGKQITGGNPLTLTLKKGSYTISGKVIDTSSNAISGAAVFARDANGNSVQGMSGSDGSYSLFANNGTWTVKAHLPSGASSVCGEFSRTVTVASASQSNQDLQSDTSTCYSITGTLTVGGSVMPNKPVFVEEWDTTNNRPSGGYFKGTSTNSSGLYTVKVPAGTFRFGTWDSSFGELGSTQTISADTTVDLSSGATASVTFAFTGGSASMDAYIELKKTNDVLTRIGKEVTGLDASESLTVPSGDYTYYVNVFGFGDFTGSVTAGNTVTIDVSTASFITVSGNVDDDSGNDVVGALVTFADSTGLSRAAATDDSGNYSIDIKAGSYTVSAGLAGYKPVKGSTTVSFSATTANYDFTTGGDQAALTASPYVLSGAIYESDGSTAMTDGFVWAKDANGLSYSGTIAATGGSYSIPVPDGAYAVYGIGPRHRPTASATTTVSGADQAGVNITLTADATRTSKSSSGTVTASDGGSVNDTDNSGIKLTAGKGVLQSGSSDVTINMEKSFTAPHTSNYTPVGDATFEITAVQGTTAITDLNGNAEISIDYSSLVADLPTGVDETDLKLVYYSNETGEYVQVEGGFAVDTTNNTITGQVDHFTDFEIVYPSGGAGSGSSAGGSTGMAQGGGSYGLLYLPGSPATAATTTQQSMMLNASVGIAVGQTTVMVTTTGANTETATLIVGQKRAAATLRKGIEKEFDLDDDGIDDVRFTYLGLISGKPRISAVNLTDAGELKSAMTINSGAYETRSTKVTLHFNVPIAREIALSNTRDFVDGVKFAPYTGTAKWTLSPGNGVKTVYVRFRDASLDVNTASDTIELKGQAMDQPAPKKEEPKKEEKKTEEPKISIAPSACPLAVGGAYKTGSAGTVYYVTKNCAKHVFTSADGFFTYFDSWDAVQIVSVALLGSVPDAAQPFPLGSRYAAKEGALVKSPFDPKVYIILNNVKRWIISPSVFDGLQYSWKWIEDVTEAVLDKFSEGDAITVSPPRPNGTIIRYSGSKQMYMLADDPGDAEQQVKRLIRDTKKLEQDGYRLDRVITIPKKEKYADGEALN